MSRASHPASGLTEDDSRDAERFVATFVQKKGIWYIYSFYEDAARLSNTGKGIKYQLGPRYRI